MSATPARLAGRRGRVAAATGAGVVAVLAAVVVGTTGGSGTDGSAAPGSATVTGAPSTAAPSSAAATPGSAAAGTTAPAAVTSSAAPAPATGSGPTDEATGRPPELPAVALDAPAGTGGVTARLTAVEAVQGNAGEGVGEVDGPAVAVTVELRNATGAELSLAGVAVELSHGADLVPAPPLDDESAAPFQGELGDGDTAVGRYVFRVPTGDRGDVTVLVEHQAGAPFLAFRGPVA